MVYTVDDIEKDLKKLSVKEFYMKYLIRSENWYFEKILGIQEKDIIKTIDDFKLIVSDSMNVSFNSIAMVGSGKVGYSLSPKKFLKPFSIDNNASDIDIAIISSELFNYFWKLFRKSYTVTQDKLYQYISRGIYRGYISDSDLIQVKNCRTEWVKYSSPAKKELQGKLYFQHEIHFRIYRDWNDMEEYHIQSIEQLKGGIDKNGN